MSTPTVEAPDYSEANKEAVYSDFETLQARTEMDRASRFGEKITYTDPRTGAVKTADFRGAIDANKFFDANPEARTAYEQAYREGDTRSPEQYVQDFAKEQGMTPNQLDTYRKDAGDMAFARQAADLALSSNERLQRGALDLRTEEVDFGGKTMSRGEANALQTAMEIKATDPQAYEARQELTKQVMDALGKENTPVVADDSFGKLGEKVAGINAPGVDSRFGELYDEAASKMPLPKDRAAEIEAATALKQRGLDPSLAAYAAEANWLTQVRDDPRLARLQGEANRLTQVGTDGRVGDIYANAAERGFGQIEDLRSEANQRLTGEVSDPTTGVLNRGLEQAMAEYELGGKLDEGTRSEIEQMVRSSQAARGNVLGDAATVVEAMELGKAAEARKAQRLQQLLDVQEKAFGQNSSLRAEERDALAQRFGTLQGMDQTGYDREIGKDALLAQLQAQEFAQKQQETQARIGTLANLQSQAAGQKQAQTAQRLATLGDVQGRVTAGNQYNDAANREDINQRFGLLNTNDAAQAGAAASRFGLLSGLVSQDVQQANQNYQNQLQGVGVSAGLVQNQITENRATRAENYGRDQQELSNASSFILGQPITNQFGALQSAQNGAVGFQQVGYQGAVRAADPAAAAGQIYGMTGQINQQNAQMKADANAQWMQAAGAVAGGAMGMM